MIETGAATVRSEPIAIAEQLPGWVPQALKQPARPWLTLLIAPLLTLPGAFALSALAGVLVPDLSRPEFQPLPWLIQLFNLVIFSPIAETLIMAGLLGLLLRWLRAVPAILSSAALWGAAHSLAAAAWGLIVWWPFVIFSLIYLVWRQRGFWTGIAMAAGAHFLHNLAPALLLITSN